MTRGEQNWCGSEGGRRSSEDTAEEVQEGWLVTFMTVRTSLGTERTLCCFCLRHNSISTRPRVAPYLTHYSQVYQICHCLLLLHTWLLWEGLRMVMMRLMMMMMMLVLRV